MKPSISIIIIFLLSITFTFAHGDLDIRIAQASEDISAQPQNSSLYFHRGKLYYQHEEFQKGIEDFNQAINKGYTSEQVNLYKSKCFYELQDFDNATSEIEKFFELNPEHVVAHKLYAQILKAEGNYRKSAREFEYVIEHSIRSLPENYIDASNSWSALGDENSIDNAIIILQKGIAKKGALITLQNHLIELLIDNKRYDQAITIQKSIIEKQNRKETAYYKLFEMAKLIEDRSLASSSLRNAETSWNLLPNRLKKNSAMIKLLSDIKTNLVNYN